MTIRLLYLLCCLSAHPIFAQIEHVEPLHWWIGMQNPEVQLLVHGAEVRELQAEIDYQGVKLKYVHSADSPNYLFLDLEISPNTQPGKFPILFKRGSETVYEWEYELQERTPNAAQRQGYTSEDVIYLITPDRFANGDPENDIVPEMKETRVDRKEGFARHGGDIQGIIDHLDYIYDMGFTALWINPLLENDQPAWSYHGYATTDYYKTDPRFGSNEQYLELSRAMKAKGMKLIMDQIVNHCGSEHWWMADPPFNNWFNFQGNYQNTNHRRTVNMDLYAAAVDKRMLEDGWFVRAMPDLNQRNPFMAKYLIQNSIWWIEYAGLGGIRMDTYPYPNKDFLSDWTCAIMKEYPNFSIVGEEWSYNPAIVAYWQRDHENHDGYVSCLPNVMDFPLLQAVTEGLLGDEAAWGEGLIKIYESLANDFLYAHPDELVIFPDNHDIDRIFTALGDAVDLHKMALTLMATIRGIPQIYYGTEIAMDNSDAPDDHGVIRTDFPGGWEGDPINAFTGKGLSPMQKEVQDYTRKLLNWRKSSPAIHHGKTLHFAPQNGLYVFFRYTEEQMVLVAINKNEETRTIDLDHYGQLLDGDDRFKDALTGEKIEGPLVIEKRSSRIVEIY